MQRMIKDLAREEITKQLPSSGSFIIPQDVVVEFVVHTLLTLIAWWMDRNTPCSAEEVDRMFHQLTLSGMIGVFRLTPGIGTNAMGIK